MRSLVAPDKNLVTKVLFDVWLRGTVHINADISLRVAGSKAIAYSPSFQSTLRARTRVCVCVCVCVCVDGG